MCVFIKGDRSFNFSTKWIKNFHAFCLLTSRACVIVHLLIALVVPIPRSTLSEEIKFSSYFKSIFNIFRVLLLTAKTAGRMNLPVIEVSTSFNFSYKNTANGCSHWKKVKDSAISLHIKRKNSRAAMETLLHLK